MNNFCRRLPCTWLWRSLLGLLILVSAWGQSPLVKADIGKQTQPLLIQTIRYHLPGATEVFIVWGIDDWTLVSEEERPAGTVVLDHLMYTPMQRDGDAFVAAIQVVSATRIDYVFQITETTAGLSAELWDTNDDSDYQALVTRDNSVTIHASPSVASSIRGDGAGVYILAVAIVITGLGFLIAFTASDKATIAISLHLSRHGVVRAFSTISLVNLIFLFGTWRFFIYFRGLSSDWGAGTPVKYLLVQFNLATENVIASWYSAMLLLLVSVGAFLCYLVDENNAQSRYERILALGWFFFSAIFLLLSFDEVGSVHEMLGMLTTLPFLNGFSHGWVIVLAVPIAIVALFFLVFGWVRVRRVPGAFALIVLGVIAFVSNPFLERVEMTQLHLTAQGGSWQMHDLFLLIEEGAEIFGSLFFLMATVTYAMTIVRRAEHTPENKPAAIHFSFAAQKLLKSLLVFIGLLGVGMIGAYLIPRYIPRGDTGIPTSWFPSALAGLTALLCWQIRSSLRDTKHRFIYPVTGLIAVLFSSYYGISAWGWFSEIESAMPFSILVLNNGLITFVILWGVVLLWHTRNSRGRVGVIAWAVLLGLALGMGKHYAAPLGFASFAALLLTLFTHLQEDRSSKTVVPVEIK